MKRTSGWHRLRRLRGGRLSTPHSRKPCRSSGWVSPSAPSRSAAPARPRPLGCRQRLQRLQRFAQLICRRCARQSAAGHLRRGAGGDARQVPRQAGRHRAGRRGERRPRRPAAGLRRALASCCAAALQAPADEWLGCAQDLIKNFEVEYIAGGATMNSIRVAQWMSQKAGATAYFGCIGKDDSGEQLKAACSAAGVNGQFLEDAVRPSAPPCLARGRLSPRSPWPEHGAARRRRRRASARRW